MVFLHALSTECLKSELELFTFPPTQVAIEGGEFVHYKAISSLSDNAPLEFVVPGHGEAYLDLAHTMLSLKVSMQKTGTKEAEELEKMAGPTNNFMHSMFSSCDIFFNQKPVSPANNAYAYRAYFETLLNYGPSAKRSSLTSVLWYDDTAGKMDDLSNNEGLKARRELFGVDDTIDLIGHLHADVLNQERFLLNGVEVRIRLVRSKNEFCLMYPEGCTPSLRILDATLLIRRVKINPSILVAHARALARTTAKYPLTRVEVKTVTLHSNIYGETIDNVLMGQLPRRVIIGFTENRGFNGKNTLNPFNFQNYNINYLSLYVDSTQIPAKPLTPDFKSKKLYVDAYQTLFTGTGLHFMDLGNGISRNDYPSGFCLFAFDLSADLSAGKNSHWNPLRHGTVRIEVRFEEELQNTVNCIIYAEYDNILEVDSARQVTLDYGA